MTRDLKNLESEVDAAILAYCRQWHRNFAHQFLILLPLELRDVVYLHLMSDYSIDHISSKTQPPRECQDVTAASSLELLYFEDPGFVGLEFRNELMQIAVWKFGRLMTKTGEEKIKYEVEKLSPRYFVLSRPHSEINRFLSVKLELFYEQPVDAAVEPHASPLRTPTERVKFKDLFRDIQPAIGTDIAIFFKLYNALNSHGGFIERALLALGDELRDETAFRRVVVDKHKGWGSRDNKHCIYNKKVLILEHNGTRMDLRASWAMGWRQLTPRDEKGHREWVGVNKPIVGEELDVLMEKRGLL